MKYTCEITINRPRDEVVALFDDPDNIPKWQEGFKSMEHISGEYGEAGAKSRLTYDMNGREVVLTETLVKRDLPEEVSMIFETDGVYNAMTNKFFDENGKTRWHSDVEFKFSGFMAIMGFFMPFMFKRQSKKNMQAFKDFAESAG